MAEQAETMSKKAKRVFSGIVVSAKMDKTVVVRVERKFKHAVLGKIVRTFRKYSAHDEGNSVQQGDLVEISECRPLSKTKRMRVERVVKSARPS